MTILTLCLHVCEIMCFTIEDKHLIKCLRVSSSNEYLILYKSKHFPPRYKRKRVGVSFVSTSDKTPTCVFVRFCFNNNKNTTLKSIKNMLWCESTTNPVPVLCIAASRGFLEFTKNVIRSSHGHSAPALQISCKSVQPFSRNLFGLDILIKTIKTFFLHL